MIKFANQVPSVYPNASRDFQLLCWLMDIVLNSVKHNVDDIYNLPNTGADHKLTELLATTLGFKVRRNYDQTQLRALAVALPRILKYKGTKIAIDMAGQTLLAASGASGSFKSDIKNGELYVVFPETLVDISLFNDLLTYILPAGMTCHIARTDMVEADINTEFNYAERLLADWVPDLEWNDKNHSAAGLAGMFDVLAAQQAGLTTANFTNDGNPNIGLLDNTVIPVIANTLVYHEDEQDTSYTEVANEYGTTVILNEYTSETNDTGTTVIAE